MKNLITSAVLLLSFSTALLSQEPKGDPLPLWKFGVTASADYCRNIKYYNNEPYAGYLTPVENGYVGWSAGLQVTRTILPHFELTAGIRYRAHTVTSGKLMLTDGTGEDLGNIRFNYQSRYIDAPIGIQYVSSPAGRFTFIGGASIVPGYAMGGWTYLKADAPNISNSVHKENINNFNSFSLAAEAYAGVGISFGACQLQVLPQFRYQLRPVANEAILNRRNWSTGIDFRLQYRF